MEEKISLEEVKKEKFSYSKLSTYETCPWRYKLTYIDKHFINDSSIATEFGTLIHFIEETIANDIKNNDNEPNFMIDNDKYLDILFNGSLDSEGKEVIGVTKLKEKYPKEFNEPDKVGLTYEDKVKDYIENGIYSLRNFLTNDKDIIILEAEKEFNLNYKGYIFHGFIDRVLKDNSTGEIIVEDIKTWSKMEDKDLVTPLQFVIYSLAASEMYEISLDKIKCYYCLPFTHMRYAAGTKGFMTRGLKKLDKLFDEISKDMFEPKPSPLCHWCTFCATNPNQKEEAKNLCPYFMKWTRQNKNKSVAYEWMGIENHDAILTAFIKEQKEIALLKEAAKKPSTLPQLNTIRVCNPTEGRMFLIRRS